MEATGDAIMSENREGHPQAEKEQSVKERADKEAKPHKEGEQHRKHQAFWPPSRRAMLIGGGVLGAGALAIVAAIMNRHYGSLRTFKADIGGSIFSVAFAPDGRTALSGRFEPWLTDLATGNSKIFDDRGPGGHHVYSVAFVPDGRTALSGSTDKTLKLWDVSTANAIHTFREPRGSVMSVAIAPDGRTALSGDFDQTLTLWDLT
jgi:WD40 repeat protein